MKKSRDDNTEGHMTQNVEHCMCLTLIIKKLLTQELRVDGWFTLGEGNSGGKDGKA